MLAPMLLLILMLILVFFEKIIIGNLSSFAVGRVFIFGFFLALPLSLLVYVSLWFRQMIAEVKAKSQRLIKAVEERRSLIAGQNAMLEEEVSERTFELNRSLEQLKSTQSQLVYAEKMASLGELTAGIAHEIQNPLNFVNNFSEVNREMIEDLKEAVASNDQAEIDAILKDLADNELKVTEHGKRAEGIVKSMLQHSRTSSGQKELTDINALCEEYLRLAYHGLRAKDKSSLKDKTNAEFKTALAEDLPKVEVVPQDIGRVILNMLNNAFHAVKAADRPLVTITTKHERNQCVIIVSDNGPGIPADIRDKIFQPFFTTKPTGEGTGLGLSLSFDIVTKGHGGKLDVETEVGKGTKFIIELPKTNQL
ncbi:MAG: GHKL domain-containing protein [Cyclobacteriaceae bacterium]